MNPSARPPLPIPAHLSEAARQFLAQPPAQAPALPQRDDTDGWLRLVEQTNGYIRTWLDDHALPSPVAVQDTQVAGVHTYVLRAEGDPATDEGPIYVDIHVTRSARATFFFPAERAPRARGSSRASRHWAGAGHGGIRATPARCCHSTRNVVQWDGLPSYIASLQLQLPQPGIISGPFLALPDEGSYPE